MQHALQQQSFVNPAAVMQQQQSQQDQLSLPQHLAKACSKCKLVKLAEEFFKDKSKPDGMYSQVAHTCNSQQRKQNALC